MDYTELQVEENVVAYPMWNPRFATASLQSFLLCWFKQKKQERHVPLNIKRLVAYESFRWYF